MKNTEIAQIIDHTLLKPDSTADEIAGLCAEAEEYAFCSVCILPVYVAHAAQLLKESDVRVCTVIGFPLGANEIQVKVKETEIAIENGADEIDMVLNVASLKSGELDKVEADIRSVVNAAKGRVVKVILETCLLTDEEKVTACNLSVNAGASFVKTSTGFSSGGATLDDVVLMRKTVGSEVGVKASGGVRDQETALKMIEAGANRLGTSSGINIVSANTQGTQDSY